MVLIDAEIGRREQLVSLLRAEGIRVVPVKRIANLEKWPVGEVLVTHVTHATPWWIEVGATHVIVLADTDEERFLARRSGATAVVTSSNPAALLSVLRTVAEASAGTGKANRH